MAQNLLPDDWIQLMYEAGYDTKQQLAFDLGITATTVSRWGDSPPLMVRRFLQAKIEPATLRRRLKECERRNRGLLRQIRELNGVVSPENRKEDDPT